MARYRQPILALPAPPHGDGGLPDRFISGCGNRRLVSASRSAPGFCAECRDATAFATVLIGVQVVGDTVYGTMLQHQPSKMQAAEGFGEKQSESSRVLPDHRPRPEQSTQSLRVGNPHLGSIWLTHTLHAALARPTLRDRQPRMAIVFYAFQIMWPGNPHVHDGCSSAAPRGDSSVPVVSSHVVPMTPSASSPRWRGGMSKLAQPGGSTESWKSGCNLSCSR